MRITDCEMAIRPASLESFALYERRSMLEEQSYMVVERRVPSSRRGTQFAAGIRL